METAAAPVVMPAPAPAVAPTPTYQDGGTTGGGSTKRTFLWLSIGFAAGMLVTNYVKNKRFAKKLEDAADKSWNKAHESVEELLKWGEANNLTPGHLLKVMRDEV